ncbi:hypothetical protein HZ994_04390 [Akkermansiaceae bacterium]|nr:hypothetical protein HZ994_04390 [Akkermansiaceae bacterium]
MLSKILGFLGLSGCVLPPVTGEREKLDALAEDGKLSVFFVGNSYSFGVPKAFGELAAAKGKDVRIGHSTFSGWSLLRHSRNPGTLKKLREGGWDVVVIQDYSKNPSRKERERRAVMDPGVQFFASEARALGAVPLLYQTWGRLDGDPEIAGDDFHAMNERVRKGYLSASRNGGGILIVKAGDAWEREFLAGRGADLFHEDGSHPGGYGNQVTAEEFYRTIFRD